MPPRNALFGLDVVRATAVTLVLLSHCGDMFARWFGVRNLPVFSYGAYYGIELFFVLSGLLIGGLLIEQLDRPDPPPRASSWRVFMLRRWLRTLPLYYLWLLALILLWAPVIWPGGEHGGALLGYLTLTQNLAWPIRAGNFFDVSWSLAVEEWFYLGFATLLFALAAVERRAALPFALPVALMLFLVAPAALRWLMRGAAESSDHLVVFWLDQIAVGVVAAWIAARHPRVFRAAAWLLPLSAGLVWLANTGGLGRLGMSVHVRRTFDVDLLAVALALLLPAACRWRQAHGAIAKLVRGVSRLSYALYLTHLSVLIYVDARRHAWHLGPWGSVALSLALVVALSYVMSRFVERPVMARRPDDRPRQANQAVAAMPSAAASQA